MISSQVAAVAAKSMTTTSPRSSAPSLLSASSAHEARKTASAPMLPTPTSKPTTVVLHALSTPPRSTVHVGRRAAHAAHAVAGYVAHGAPAIRAGANGLTCPSCDARSAPQAM